MRSLLTCLLLGLPAPALGDFDYPDFTDTTNLDFVGAGSAVLGRARVCPSVPNIAGGVWYATRQDVVSPWTSEFVFEMSGGGHGLVFLIQRDSQTPLGGAGELLGYDGVTNSLALELDVIQDVGLSDPSGNHLSWHSGGSGANSVHEASSRGATGVVPLLADGQPHTVRLTYVPGALRVFVDDLVHPALQVDVDIDALLDLDDGTAWLGFTAACGASWQNHFVDSWSFDEQATTWGGNRAPSAPTINEPQNDGDIANPYDVHMETSSQVDADGDAHAASDFQIYVMTPSERVWEGNDLTGLESLHAHLADGVFVGSYAGFFGLKEQEAYVLRVRHRDDSGDPWSSAGPWSERHFQTGASGEFHPLVADDLLVPPAPVWLQAQGGAPVVLPGGGTQPGLFVEGPAGEALLWIEGDDGVHNHVTDGPPLNDHVPMRLRVFGGATGVALPETDLVVVDHECQGHTLLLPSLAVAPAQEVYLWVSAEGATWWGAAGQDEPDFSSLARGSSLPWVVTRPNLEVEVVAEGLTLPVNVAFVPSPGSNPGDPLLYVTELYGTIKVVTNEGGLRDYATGLLNYDPTGSFPGSGEQGLTGIAVDPATGDVIATMLYDAGGPHYPKVVRFTSTNGGLSAATQTTLLDMAGELQGQSHQISHVEVHPDGHLLVHMGDGFDAKTAQDLGSFRGKILRMNLDGTPAASNPFYDPGDGIDAADYVWASGFRNPFGGRYREADGRHYEVENGPSIDRLVQVVPGHDYGWNGGSQDMLQDALYNWSPAHAPVNLAFLQPGTFGGSGFPEGYMGRLYVTESGPTYAPGPQARGKRIVELVLDGAGNVVSGPAAVAEYVGTGRATAVGLAAGPDGLYFTELYRDQGSDPTAAGARLLRLQFHADGDCDGFGTSYCEPAVANSTGVPAELHAHGSDHVADNDLTLEAHDLPPNQFGYFMASMSQGFVSGPGGSEGNLCLSGKIGRFASQLQSSGPAGELELLVDLNSLPPPLGAVQPGETWCFQAWYRDANPAPTSNFTQGLSVDFH